ncbi:hemolysin III family protein [soil metagenome]
MTHDVAETRPLFRGWLHAAVLPFAVAGAFMLWRSVGGGVPARMSVAVFGASLVGVYLVSACYHVLPWSARARRVLARCDGAMIQLFIAGTFTPIAFHTLSGGWRTWSLVVAWAVALVGAGIAASPVEAPRWLGTAGYIAVGWLTVVPFTQIVLTLPWEGTALVVIGGLLYTVGALVYAKRWPDPFPRWFGFHEVFHLFVIAASVCHYIAIWQYVLPAAA